LGDVDLFLAIGEAFLFLFIGVAAIMFFSDRMLLALCFFVVETEGIVDQGATFKHFDGGGLYNLNLFLN
jgi:hypothetical protein